MSGSNQFDIRTLPKCDDLFQLGRQIGSGVTSKVFEATEKRSGRKLAVKIVQLTAENEEFAREECRILSQLPKHENIVDLYDIYYNKNGDNEEVWIVMELCLGTAADFVRLMHEQDKKVEDCHLSHILKGLIQAVTHLHENCVIHRDIKGTNILIAKNGEIRLADFGASLRLNNAEDTANTRIGSPGWMAPEMIPKDGVYTTGVDIWAMGITAMELADGQAPFQDMHPARALFHIARNPPPTFIRSSSRSQLMNDFINESLEKNPENRPVIQEFLGHPLFQDIDPNINVQELLLSTMNKLNDNVEEKKYLEILVRGDCMKVENQEEEKILHEDLAMLENATEEGILNELEERLKKKDFCTFIGDILLVLNPYSEPNIYGPEYHEKYRFKARSDNIPHIYSVADSAYQDVVHHEESQQILLTGETVSGKTTNMLHILDHLLYLGQGYQCCQNVKKSIDIIHALGNAATVRNPNSTRHILQTQVSLTGTGKISGAIFWIYQLEKNRVTSTDRYDRNFHIFYYLFYALQSENKLAKYYLEGEKSYEFLRNDTSADRKGSTAAEYAQKFIQFEQNLMDLGFVKEQIQIIRRVLAAILVLGELEFSMDGDGNAKIMTQSEADAVADLLGLEPKKFSWALLKYCAITKGEAVMRYHTVQEAMEAKNVLARGLYFRLVDWIVNCINEKFSIPRALYGDKHTINILDIFGFECSNTNSMDQLIINTMNEQLQFYYNQKIFAWEMQNAAEEEISVPTLNYHDNKIVMDQILSKSDGLMFLIDEATKTGSSLEENIKNAKKSHISSQCDNQFAIAHYTGKITYKISEVLNRNRDFLPPEMIETMRRSSLDDVRKLFTGLLTTTGNLTMHSDSDKTDNREGRWNTGFSASNKKFRGRKFNTSSKGQYSQSRQMRTTATTFRATCMEILRSITSIESNIHFVRCIRSNLSNTPYEYQRDIIRQQLKAFGILETVQAKQNGYSYRISFSDFIRRYKFLAFDFNENVEETKENCRLLLIRQKMEGWAIGKTKVCLKYYDKEYLSRLYGINVRKIVKVQSMMRSFLARRNLRKKIARFQESIGIKQNAEDKTSLLHVPSPKKSQEPSNFSGSESEFEPECEEKNQPNLESQSITTVHNMGCEIYENYNAIESTEDLDTKSLTFIKPWFKKWRMQSIYQILVFYSSKQQRTLVYFCQQIHLFNQNNRSIMESVNEEIDLTKLDLNIDPKIFIERKLSVHKIGLKLGEFKFFDNSHICPSTFNNRNEKDIDDKLWEDWDAPLKPYYPKEPTKLNNVKQDKECQTQLTEASDVIKNDSSNTSLTQKSKTDESKINTYSTVGVSNTDEIKEGKRDTCNDVDKVQELSQNNETDPERVPQAGERNGEVPNNTASPIRNFKMLKDTKHAVDNTKYKTPIKELEEKFKTTDITDSDNPPYNFRAMLRKTNYFDPSYQRKTEWSTNTYHFTLGKKLRRVEELRSPCHIISTEIAPGIIIQGEVTDL